VQVPVHFPPKLFVVAKNVSKIGVLFVQAPVQHSLQYLRNCLCGMLRQQYTSLYIAFKIKLAYKNCWTKFLALITIIFTELSLLQTGTLSSALRKRTPDNPDIWSKIWSCLTPFSLSSHSY
jgi:hypothetical protein